MMPQLKCPITGCDYETPEYEAPIVAALLNTHASTHNVVPPLPPTPAKVERVRRPTVTSAGTSEEWTYFESRWNDYKKATQIKDKKLIIQLLECCDETLRKDLTRTKGDSLTEESEDYVLAAIRQLAVREENTMVARVTLHNMCQDREETVIAFGARLRGQACVCKFILPCTHCNQVVNYTDTVLRDVREENTMVARVTLHNMCQDREETVIAFGARLRGQACVCKFILPCTHCNQDVNYTDTVLRDVLVRCLYDQEIQLDLLGTEDQNMTVRELG